MNNQHHHASQAGAPDTAEHAPKKLVKDPVCGMTIDPAKAAAVQIYQGETIHFCSTGCEKKFLAAPATYISPTPRVKMAAAKDSMYTCPMHPEILQDHPGDCPKCGMALEPVTPSANDGENYELADMKRRFWISTFLTLPLFAASMLDMVPGLSLQHRLPPGWFGWLQFALATPVTLWGGFPLLVKAWRSVRNVSPNMFTLIGLGALSAYFFSLVALVFPQAFPDAFRSHAASGHGAVDLYFEAAAVIITLVLLGQVLELSARAATGGAIKALLGLKATIAHRVDDDGAEKDVPLEHVHKGHMLRVKPGEKVPVDGVVVSGESYVDESMITGESKPLLKAKADKVTGSTLNTTGSFIMRAERVGSETLLSQIVNMVSAAQRSRAPIQRLADIVSAWFVPAVVLVAVITFIVWAVFGPQPRFAYAFVNAVAVLIIACPCALGLATPMSIMVGVGNAARHGILVKNAEAMETLVKVDTLVVDKTGTLTEGKPSVIEVFAAPGFEKNTVLSTAAALEVSSEHPLARAIVEAAGAQVTEEQINSKDVSDFASMTGSGVTAEIRGQKFALGNEELMEKSGISTTAAEEFAATHRSRGETVVYLARGETLAGVIAIADKIKPTTKDAIIELTQKGIQVMMLTGDNEETARAVANQLGIKDFKAGIKPEDKAAYVQTLITSGHITAMAGDGVNDAPALALAHVGIAMGTGTDAAIESAGITLVKGDLGKIVTAIQLSHGTMANIKQNLIFAFAYNLLGVPIAAGLLYPFFGILLSPMLGAAAMSLSSVSVITNALRLRGR
jgi:P-type Cu+ transporter